MNLAGPRGVFGSFIVRPKPEKENPAAEAMLRDGALVLSTFSGLNSSAADPLIGRSSRGHQGLQNLFGRQANPPHMDEQGRTRRSGVQSVGVGAALLRALADAEGPEPLGVLARAAKMSPAKAHRYLVSFVQAGLVVQLERTGEYDLGPLATRLGLAAIQRFDVVRVAGERLGELRDAVDATTLLALWTDLGPTVARIALSDHPVTLAVRIGTAFPILSTATGRVYLAFGDQSDVGRLSSAGGAPHDAETDVEAIRDRVRADGVAHVDQTFLVGVEALSGPLFDAEGRLAAAVTIITRPGQLDLTPHGPVSSHIRAFAARIRGA